MYRLSVYRKIWNECCAIGSFSWIYEKNSFRTYQLCVDVLLIALVRYIFTLFVLHSLAHYLAGHRNKEILLLNVIVLFTGFLYYLFLITKINMDLHFVKSTSFSDPKLPALPTELFVWWNSNAFAVHTLLKYRHIFLIFYIYRCKGLIMHIFNI